MKNYLLAIFVGLLLAGGVVVLNTFYIVDESEQVVITQFGEPVGDAIREAGLYTKIPFIQEVNRFDKRILEWDGDPNQIPTRDKRYIWVDATARWKIIDPLRFLQSLGSQVVAQARLDDILDAAMRDAISNRNLVEAIRDSNKLFDRKKDVAPDETADVDIIFDSAESERVSSGQEALTRDIRDRAALTIRDFGIELIDVRIKRINYVNDVMLKVFDRMISERKRAAEQYRSLGQGKKAEIEGKMGRELEQISSEAYRKAQETVGNADAQAINIYAEAYNRDPQFYTFLKTLETYRKTVDSATTLMLSTDSELFRFFKSSAIAQ